MVAPLRREQSQRLQGKLARISRVICIEIAPVVPALAMPSFLECLDLLHQVLLLLFLRWFQAIFIAFSFAFSNVFSSAFSSAFALQLKTNDVAFPF
jgi:hypothetical protein